MNRWTLITVGYILALLILGTSGETHPTSACPPTGKYLWDVYGTEKVQGQKKANEVTYSALTDTIGAAIEEAGRKRPSLVIQGARIKGTVGEVQTFAHPDGEEKDEGRANARTEDPPRAETSWHFITDLIAGVTVLTAIVFVGKWGLAWL